MKRYALPLFLFAIAFVAFYAGLTIGLTQSPGWGTILWVLAGAFATAGLARLMKS